MTKPKEKERKKRVCRTLEERQIILQEKINSLEVTKKNRKFKKIWSTFRETKGNLNKDRDLDYIAKIQSFVNWVFVETNISENITIKVEEQDINNKTDKEIIATTKKDLDMNY